MSPRKPGRPRTEEKQPGLLDGIQMIADNMGSAEPKRRSEVIHSNISLERMTKELRLLGFKVEKTAVYHRIAP